MAWQCIYGAWENLKYVLLFAGLSVDWTVLHYLPVRGLKKHGVMHIECDVFQSTEENEELIICGCF